MSTANIAPAATTGAGGSLRAWIARRPLPVFFVLAFALTWPYMIVDALGSLPFVLWIPMGYGPTFAALIVTAATEGKGSVRALLRRLLVWRVGPQWYALVIFGSAIPTAITLGLYTLLGGDLTAPPLSLVLILQQLVVFLVRLLLNGEEIGWRGYALPRLQANRSALAASLILAVPWALFHLPYFFTQGNAFSSTPPLSYLLSTMATSIIFTWVFNNTRGSVLLAHMLHQALNIWTVIYLPDPAGSALFSWLGTGMNCLVALIVVVVYGAARLSRKPVAELPVQIDTSILDHTD